MIRAMEHGVVRELAVAQVILDLAGAVKELIENAVDAGATQVCKI